MNQIKFRSLLFLTIISNLIYSCKNDDPVDEEFKFPSKVINKILIDNLGVKWFATEKGVISFDGTKWTSYSDNQKLSNGSVADLVFDGASGIKKIWLGTNVGLSSFELGTTAISFVNYKTTNSGILSDTVSALGVAESNIKYVGTSLGLSILKGSIWDKYLGRKGEGEILAKYKISAVAAAKNGYIYASTEGGGISRFKYTDAISGATTFNRPWANGLQSDTVFTVMVDNDSHQWYGTAKGAAYHASEYTKEEWTSYSRADGLVCDTVYAIAKDISGNIWFGTHKGVSKFTGDTWQNYTTKDGLIANKVNTIAVDVDGSLWFGTDQGISHYNSNSKWVNY